MINRFSRTEMLFGARHMDKLFKAKVAVFGLGGVGGIAAEALARSGVGTLDIFDNDKICPTNINRQIFATDKSIGMLKVDAAEMRIKEINPEAVINKFPMFFSAENAESIDFSQYDYVIDAIDSVSSKIELILSAQKNNTPIISCMGMGNKVEPALIEVSDIYSTSVCPLAKVMRNELKKRGVQKLKVVYSKEPALKPVANENDNQSAIAPPRRQTPGSTAFVPPVAGLIMAGEVVKNIIAEKNYGANQL